MQSPAIFQRVENDVLSAGAVLRKLSVVTWSTATSLSPANPIPSTTQRQHSLPCPDGAPRDRQVPWPQEHPGKGFTCSCVGILHHTLGCPWLPSSWAWFTTKMVAWRLT